MAVVPEVLAGHLLPVEIRISNDRGILNADVVGAVDVDVLLVVVACVEPLEGNVGGVIHPDSVGVAIRLEALNHLLPIGGEVVADAKTDNAVTVGDVVLEESDGSPLQRVPIVGNALSGHAFLGESTDGISAKLEPKSFLVTTSGNIADEGVLCVGNEERSRIISGVAARGTVVLLDHLGQGAEIALEGVAGFCTILEHEAVAPGVVGDVALD
mmetsp:Transcript_8726/g.20568  ORF Transcript_8726/g.20568 Transcript_8726/m.20568 type:complete len:213 (-) Transcript_8726:1045-1683(-)